MTPKFAIRFAALALLLAFAMGNAPHAFAQSNLLSTFWTSGTAGSWSFYDGNSYITSAGGAGYDGDAYMLEMDNTSSTFQTAASQSFSGLTAGQQFTASVWAETASTTTVGPYVAVYDNSNQAQLCYALLPANVSSWAQYSCTATVPSSGELKFQVGSGTSNPANAWVEFDSPSLSISTPAQPANLALNNPIGLGDTTAGWNFYDGNSYITSAGGAGYDGDGYMLEMNNTGSPFQTSAWQIVTGLAAGQFTASVWAKTSSTTTVLPYLAVYDNSNQATKCNVVLPANVSSWTQYSCTATVPSSGELKILFGSGTSNPANAWVEFDSPSLVVNSTPVPSNLLSNDTWGMGNLTDWTVIGSPSSAVYLTSGGGYGGDTYVLNMDSSSSTFQVAAYQNITSQPSGHSFTATVWAETASTTPSNNYVAVFDGGNGTLLCVTDIPAGVSFWSPYSCSGTVPSSGELKFQLGTGTNNPANAWVLFDSASLTVSSSAVTTTYQQEAADGVVSLQQWYSPSTGVWSADSGSYGNEEATYTLADYEKVTGDTSYYSVLSDTYTYAPSSISPGPGFVSDYFDDIGTWALAWIAAYDATGNTTYLTEAETLFSYIATNGWDTSTCGGGVKQTSGGYKNASANEPFIAIAAKLANRTTGMTSTNYLGWATTAWSWFKASGMINSQNLVNDGLNTDCTNNGGETWTYNQGVILGGLVEIYQANGDSTMLPQAEAIADAALANLTTSGGILNEPDYAELGPSGNSLLQFKGAFMRNLMALYAALPSNDQAAQYQGFVDANADSIWNNDTNGSNQFGYFWQGPFDGSPDAGRQSSALNALVAATAM
jgi:predicted alpha-1,6-mannanase (GH76 family)